MAVTDSYATAAEYRPAVNKDDTGEDAEVLVDLTAVSRYIEKKLDRFFNKDVSDVARNYYGNGTRYLHTDDISASPTSVVVDENRDGTVEETYASTVWQLYPLNAAKGPEPSPFQAIYLPSWSTKSVWPSGTLVTVTAKFGWPSVPEAVKRACIHLTAILRLETPRSSRAVDDTGQILEASHEARGIITDLIRHYGKVSF